MIQLPIVQRAPKVLVENKVSFAAEQSELSIYDTYQRAERVRLCSDQLMFCGMLSGKKIMHANHANIHQTFLPHESFVIAPNKAVEIDFPEARMDKPTTCLAIEITPQRITKVADQLNVVSPINADFNEWTLSDNYVHTHHSPETQALLNRIVHIFTENHVDRKILIDLAVTELSVRLLRHQTRDLIVSCCQRDPEKNSITAVCHYILNNLTKPLDINALARLACMSRSKFYMAFKQHIGITPTAFQSQQRLKLAAEKIARGQKITTVCYALGFASPSHFSRSFKGCFGMTPYDYKKQYQSA